VSDLIPRIVAHAGSDALDLAVPIWRCYDEVFGDHDDYESWRTNLFQRHAARDGYRLLTVSEADTVIAFAWGYIGERGQFWPDLVCEALPPEICSEWVGGHFEVVELGVLEEHRRNGWGHALHDGLLKGIERRCLLGTKDDADDPAVRLYLRAGWRKLGVLRPGVQVMGLDRRRVAS
jgi:ribosomal protein S18 acetylase RimI-like enzyme